MKMDRIRAFFSRDGDARTRKKSSDVPRYPEESFSEPDDAEVLKIPETPRGFQDFRRAFEFEEGDLEKVLAGKKVLDLGSGIGRLAIDLYMRALEDPKFRGPKELWSLNARYALKSYPRKWYSSGGNRLIASAIKAGRRAQLKEAIRNLQKFSLSDNWNDLSRLQAKGEKFDVIFGSFSFPYYSDTRRFEKNPDKDGREWKDFLQLGPGTRKSFAQLAKLQKTGDLGFFVTSWDYEGEWAKIDERQPDFRKEIDTFFRSIGYSVRVGHGMDGLTGLFLTKK